MEKLHEETNLLTIKLLNLKNVNISFEYLTKNFSPFTSRISQAAVLWLKSFGCKKPVVFLEDFFSRFKSSKLNVNN